jgi:oligopeptide transport system substrate-binding protein
VTNLRLTAQLDEPLFELRRGPCIAPRLARRLEVSDSGLEYRVTLRNDLTFNDGDPFTAQSAVEGFRTFLRRSIAGTELWSIRGASAFMRGDESELGIEAVDELTVRFSLTAPIPHFPFFLTYSHLGGAFPGKTNGAFKVVSIEPGRAVIEADPDYRRPRTGNVARVEWVKIDFEDATDKLAASEVDVLLQMPDLRRLRDMPGVTESSGAVAFALYLVPSGKGPAVDDALRMALALSIDRERLAALTDAHQMVATGGIVPPGLPGHSPGIAQRFDPDSALRWLGQSAHKGPLKVAHFIDRPNLLIDAAIESWREVLGLEIERNGIPMRDVEKIALTHHVMQNNWSAGVPDPDYFLRELFHSTSGSNFSGTSDADVDAILDRATRATSGPERLALLHEADRLIVATKCLAIPVMYATVPLAMKNWVHDWWEWSNATQMYSDLQVGPESPRARRS